MPHAATAGTPRAADQMWIMKLAGPPDYRRPLGVTWWYGFANLLNAYFPRRSAFRGRIADLGPGHYQFEDLVVRRGCEVTAVERDPALAELGRMKGHRVLERDWNGLRQSDFGGPLDGVFSKFAVSAFFYDSPAQAFEFFESIDDLLAEGGWGWIAPWNGPTAAHPPKLMDALAEAQRTALAGRGWVRHELSPEDAELFGVLGQTYDRPLFTKNLTRGPVELGEWRLSGRGLHPRARAAMLVQEESAEADGICRPSWAFLDFFRRAVAPLLRSGVRVLEFGPEGHEFADAATEAAASVVSVDLEPVRLASARRRGYDVIDAAPHSWDESTLGARFDGFFSWPARLPRAVFARLLDAVPRVIADGGWAYVVARRRDVDRLTDSERARAVQTGWTIRAWSDYSDRDEGPRTAELQVLALGQVQQVPRAHDAPMAWIAANSPEYRWIAAALQGQGYRVAFSFNAEFDRYVGKSRGHTLVFAAERGAVTVDVARVSAAMGADWARVAAAASGTAVEPIVSDTLPDGTAIRVFSVEHLRAALPVPRAIPSTVADASDRRSLGCGIIEASLARSLATRGFRRPAVRAVRLSHYFNAVLLDDDVVGACMNYARIDEAELRAAESHAQRVLCADPLLRAFCDDRSIDSMLRRSVLAAVASALAAPAIAAGGDDAFVAEPADEDALFSRSDCVVVVGFGGYMHYFATERRCRTLRVIDLQLEQRRTEMEDTVARFLADAPPGKSISLHASVDSEILAGADTVCVTGSALCNGTMESLLELVAPGRNVVVQGQSAAIHPGPLFERGASAVVTTLKPRSLFDEIGTPRAHEVLEGGLPTVMLRPRA